MFHPVVKSACSYLNCSFCPHCFFLQFSLFLPFGMMYITINQRRSQRNFRHILHKEEGRKLCMIPTKKASPTLPCVGHLWERENHLEETNPRRTRATQRLYEPQPLSGLWSWAMGFGLPSGLALPFKFAGVFVLLIEKGIVIDFLFRKVNAGDFLKGRSVFLGVCLCKAFCVFLNPCGELLVVHPVLVFNLQFVFVVLIHPGDDRLCDFGSFVPVRSVCHCSCLCDSVCYHCVFLRFFGCFPFR
nr:MAG TPA: hypothetical protein [Caudoviricetes sp.]